MRYLPKQKNMNKHIIEYVDKSEYYPEKVSKAINAKVVADVRLSNRTTSGGFVARPATLAKATAPAPQKGIVRLIQGFKVMMRAAL